jgi:mutator protein MutT
VSCRKYRSGSSNAPSLEALAIAPDQEVTDAWYPLGYNIRPKRLQTIARESVARYGGQLPADEETLLSFKGIGAYTAGAIRSFAFRERAAILDTNVARVLFRVFIGEGDPKSPATRRHLWRLSETLMPVRHVFDFNQALMDLGAMVCVSRIQNAWCAPWRRAAGRSPSILANHDHGRRRRRDHRTRRSLSAHAPPERRPSRSYWEFPGGKCEPGETHTACLVREIREELGVEAAVGEELLATRHAYVDRQVELHFLRCTVGETAGAAARSEMRWVAREDLATLAFPPADTEVDSAIEWDGLRPSLPVGHGLLDPA